MTPDEYRALLARNVGKRIKMENRAGTLCGVIHGVQGKLVLVTNVVATMHEEGNRRPIIYPREHVDRWGTPGQDVQVQPMDGKTIFTWPSNGGTTKVTLLL